MTVRITHDPETSVYTHSKKAWSNSYPLSRLPEWIAFYKKQRQGVSAKGPSCLRLWPVGSTSPLSEGTDPALTALPEWL